MAQRYTTLMPAARSLGAGFCSLFSHPRETADMMETPTFSKAAVAAPHRSAAEAGRAMLAEGGNAIEAMLAMAATIAVVYPHMNSFGGDAFWLIREPGGRVRYIEAA